VNPEIYTATGRDDNILGQPVESLWRRSERFADPHSLHHQGIGTEETLTGCIHRRGTTFRDKQRAIKNFGANSDIVWNR
jgi:hypothetical protein